MGQDAPSQDRSSHAPGLRRLTTVVAADICGYSRMAEADETAAIRTVKMVSAAFENAVSARRGRVFHRAGDGFLAELPSAADGVLAALDFVDAVSAMDTFSPANPGAKVRAGVHVGDVAEQPDGDLLGHGVNIAARLQQEAGSSAILVSAQTLNLVDGNVDARFVKRGAVTLRNITAPVTAYECLRGGVSHGVLQRFAKSLRRFAARRGAPLLAGVVTLAALSYAFNAKPTFLNQDALNATRAEDGAAVNQTNSQDLEEIAQAWRTLKAPPRSPSETIWLRSMLSELRRSGEEIDRTVFAQLTNKNLGAAVKALQEDFSQRQASLSPDEKISLLLNLGALTFTHAPSESIAYHSRILDIDPENFTANVRLGELYYHQSDYLRADMSFTEALRIGSAQRDQEVYAIVKHAASLTIEEKYEVALEMLRGALREARENGWDSLVVLAYNRIAFAELKQGNFDAAREALAIVTAFGGIDDYPEENAFALTALGRMELESGDFSDANSHFEAALDLEMRMGRAVGMADTYFYIGVTEVELGDAKAAERTFQNGVDVARGGENFGYNNLKNMEVKNLIGKAFAYGTQGRQERACQQLRLAENLDAKGGLVYNDLTQSLIRRTGCSYAPIGYAGEPISPATD